MDQTLLDRLAVDLLHERDEFVLADGCDSVQNGVGILITGLNPFEIENTECSQFRESNGHVDIHNAIHGTGNDRNFTLNSPEGPPGVGDIRIDGAASWNKSDFIDSVGPPNGFGASELNIHR